MAECASSAFNPGVKRRDPFVRVGDRHHRGLADDDGAGDRQVGAEARDRVNRPETGGLLVVAQHDVDRAF